MLPKQTANGKELQCKSKLSNFLLSVGCLFFWLMIWHIFSLIANQEILFPRPFTVLKSLLVLFKELTFWKSVFESLLRVLEGFFAALVVGIIMAIVTSVSRIAARLFYPLISTIKATPVASFIILALVWITKARIPAFTCFLMVLPTVWTNIAQGISSTDKDLLEVSKNYKFSRIKTIKMVFVPSVFPYFKAAFAAGLGMAWKAGVAAEVIGKPEFSIGKALYTAKVNLEMSDMFAWTAVVIILSVLLEKLLVFFVNKVGKSSIRKEQNII